MDVCLLVSIHFEMLYFLRLLVAVVCRKLWEFGWLVHKFHSSTVCSYFGTVRFICFDQCFWRELKEGSLSSDFVILFSVFFFISIFHLFLIFLSITSSRSAPSKLPLLSQNLCSFALCSYFICSITTGILLTLYFCSVFTWLFSLVSPPELILQD